MSTKRATAAIDSALLKDEQIVATVEGSLMPAGTVRGVLALTDKRLLFRGSGAGKSESLSFRLSEVAAVDVTKGLMQAFVTIAGSGAQVKVRAKYADAQSFADAAQQQLAALV